MEEEITYKRLITVHFGQFRVVHVNREMILRSGEAVKNMRKAEKTSAR